MLPEIAVEEYSAVLDAVVAEILADAGLECPPVDAFRVADALRITVAWDGAQPERGRFVRLRPARGRAARPTMVLRPDPRSEREQWAAAHEIGEHAACRAFSALGVDPWEAAAGCRERACDHLAVRLLLPTSWFASCGAECDWDLFALKRRFSTASHEVIARRMLEMAPPVIVSIFDQGRLRMRQSNLAGGAPRLCPTEAACWRVAHREGRAGQALDEMVRVRAWPIHEEGWKREILRTELAEC